MRSKDEFSLHPERIEENTEDSQEFNLNPEAPGKKVSFRFGDRMSQGSSEKNTASEDLSEAFPTLI